jgi:cell division protein FtsI/penicillin-binding protein 2
VNTWFAYMAEQADGTLAAPVSRFGLPLAIGDALDEARPTLRVAHQLGFGVAHRLDGNLFGDTLPADSVLRATASLFDPLRDQHQLRLLANGARAQATPLQMAMVASAVATGKIPTVRLLRGLDELEPVLGPALALDMRLDRIRAAMKSVVVEGTARTAFSANEARRALRPVFFGKTGTADCRGCLEPNLAWFIGYFETPGRRYAFAVRIQSARKRVETGGRLAAEVIAALGESLAWRGVIPLTHGKK